MNSQVHHSTATGLFELVLNRRILEFKLKSTVSTVKILTISKQRTRLLATLHHLLYRANDSFMNTEERLKGDSDRGLCKSGARKGAATMRLLMYNMVSLKHER